MPADCLVSTSWSHISYCLKDAADNDRILRNDLYFYKLTDINQHNKLRKMHDKDVFMTYAAFPAAVLAIVKITLHKRNKDSDPAPHNLSGKIMTSYGNTYGHKYPGIVLLNVPASQPIEAMSNAPIELSRDAVVVPAYSFLRIDVRLYQTQQEDICCQADFLAKRPLIEHANIETKDFDVRFEVNWRHPNQMRNETKTSSNLHVDAVIGGEPSLRMKSYSLGEVYTIMIHHDTNNKLKIFGRTEFSEIGSLFSLFDRNESNPVIISGYEDTIPINVTKRCFRTYGSFTVGSYLRDVEGRVSIKGNIIWGDHHIKKPIWYDKRICSVIKGVHGYATVFYTIFREALQAEISIVFKCDGFPNETHRLGGSIVARHSNEKYYTEHDRAYYQSVLFQGKTSDVKSGDTLTLVKSLVAVPTDAFLTVVFDLYVSPLSHDFPEEHLTWEVDFKMGPGVERVEGENYSYEASIVWKKIPNN